MRMLDAERKQSVRQLQLYLTVGEAKELVRYLEDLLTNPERNDHHHVITEGHDLSFSIITPAKLASGRYTKLEKQILDER